MSKVKKKNSVSFSFNLAIFLQIYVLVPKAVQKHIKHQNKISTIMATSTTRYYVNENTPNLNFTLGNTFVAVDIMYLSF
jgi:hypothetical protein